MEYESSDSDEEEEEEEVEEAHVQASANQERSVNGRHIFGTKTFSCLCVVFLTLHL